MNIQQIVEEIIEKNGAFDREEMIEKIAKNWTKGFNPHKGDLLSMFNESVPKRGKNFITIDSMDGRESIADVIARLADYLGEGSFGDVVQNLYEADSEAIKKASKEAEKNPFAFYYNPIEMEETYKALKPYSQIDFDKDQKTFYVKGKKGIEPRGSTTSMGATALIMEKLNHMQKHKDVVIDPMTYQEELVTKAVATLIVLNAIAKETELDNLQSAEDFYSPMILQMMTKIGNKNNPISSITENASYLAQEYLCKIDPNQDAFKGREPDDYFHDSKIINSLSKIATKNSDMNADVSGKGRKLAFVNEYGQLEVLPEAADVKITGVKAMLKSKNTTDVLGAFNALDKELFAKDRTDFIGDSLIDTASIMLANLIVLENTEGIEADVKTRLEQAFMIPFMQSTATLSAENMQGVVRKALVGIEVTAGKEYIDIDMKELKKTASWAFKEAKTKGILKNPMPVKLGGFNAAVEYRKTLTIFGNKLNDMASKEDEGISNEYYQIIDVLKNKQVELCDKGIKAEGVADLSEAQKKFIDETSKYIWSGVNSLRDKYDKNQKVEEDEFKKAKKDAGLTLLGGISSKLEELTQVYKENRVASTEEKTGEGFEKE